MRLETNSHGICKIMMRSPLMMTSPLKKREAHGFEVVRGGCYEGGGLSGVGSLSHGNPPDATRKNLEAWVLSTLPRALGYASSLLRDKALADDVVHDCYLRLLQKAEVYDLLRDGTKLLYKAITNACIDRNHRDRMVLSLSGAGSESDGSDAVVDVEQAGPLQIVIQKELEE